MAKARPVAAGGKARHIPQRMCVICRTSADKRTLTRLVRTADAGIQIDPTGKASGRGAYLCDQAVCWQRAFGERAETLEKALRTPLGTEDKARLLAAAPPAGEPKANP